MSAPHPKPRLSPIGLLPPVSVYRPLSSVFCLPRPSSAKAGLLASALCLLLATACSHRDTPVEVGTGTQTLHVGVGADPNDLDPQMMSTNQGAAISMALSEGLTNYDPHDLHPVPGVAESWEVAPGGLAYTFHLRANARWSNGDPITADDFVFSAHRILSPAYAGEYAYMFFPVRGAEDFQTGRLTDFAQVGIRALDPHTLRYELRQPAPYFLTLVAHWAWYPVHAPTILKFGRIDEPSTAWTKPGNFVGNGPFTLASWRTGEGLVVKKNPQYWDAARVRLQEIDFHFIDSPETEERAFRNGQLHLTVSLPRSKVGSYHTQPASPLLIVPLYATDMVYLNLQKPPLDNPLVRQALSLAIDRAVLGNQVMQDGSQPATSLLPDDAHGYTYSGEPKLHFDPVEARRLLASAGYPDGKNFPQLELSYPNGNHAGTISEALQQMWRQHLGVEIGLTGQERRVFVDELHRHRYTMAISGWIGDYLDPMSFLDVFIATSGHNDPGYLNPEYDRLITAAGNTAEPARRYAIFAQAESQLMRDLPIFPLYHRPNLHLVDPAVHGFHPNLMDMHPYQDMWLEK